jgi:hypothetical protein
VPPLRSFFGDETLLTKLRISIVQYLNTAPLVWGFTHGPLAGKYDLSFTVPSQCAEALREDEADIAIIRRLSTSAFPAWCYSRIWPSRRKRGCAAFCS